MLLSCWVGVGSSGLCADNINVDYVASSSYLYRSSKASGYVIAVSILGNSSGGDLVSLVAYPGTVTDTTVNGIEYDRELCIHDLYSTGIAKYDSSLGMYYKRYNGVNTFYAFLILQDDGTKYLYFRNTPTKPKFQERIALEVENSVYFKGIDLPELSNDFSWRDFLIDQLKIWIIIPLVVGLGFLLVRFGWPLLLRIAFPLAILSAISNIGRRRKDEG